MKNLNDIKITPELMKQIENCANASELVELAKSNDVQLSDEDAEKILSMINTELTEVDLEKVSGGCDSDCTWEWLAFS